MELDENEEKMEKEEETITHTEVLNMLQNKPFNGDKSSRMQNRKYPNDITLNKEQTKIFDDMLAITENKQLILYL